MDVHRMPALLTDSQAMSAAKQSVLAALPYSRKFLESLQPEDLPDLSVSECKICGPAADNAAVYVTYPDDWTGLAVRTDGQYRSYWLIGKCADTGEREWNCLGPQPSIEAAITAAMVRVALNMAYWQSQGDRYQTAQVA